MEKTRGDGEHAIQRAIGGRKGIKDRVCQQCNNSVLSDIDRELCSRSFLSIAASQEIDGHLSLVWDVDHDAKNLLVEARPVWDTDNALRHLVAYPQLVFECHGTDVRGDLSEMKGFGRAAFETALKKAASIAFERYHRGKRDSIVFEKCESGILRAGFRLAPRLYVHGTIGDIGENLDKARFYLRYATDDEKNFALDTLSKLHRQPPSQRFTNYLGSHTPTIALNFDVGKAVRGLLKMAFNLAMAVTERTEISRCNFRYVVDEITGARSDDQTLLARCGFVCHGDAVTAIAAPDKGHGFLINYVGGLWHVHSSFFGGRLGAYVNFPGPHSELWGAVKIMAPLHSKDWTVTPGLIVPMKAFIEHKRSQLICPSLQIENTVSEMQVAVVRKKKSRPQ